MTGFLVDTNVLSEFSRHEPNEKAIAFVSSGQELYISCITFLELRFGADKAAGRRQREDFLGWISHFKSEFGDRILSINDHVAETSGRLKAAAALKGFNVPAMDALIAGTAVCSDLVVATRNVKDFKALGVTFFNPWTGERS